MRRGWRRGVRLRSYRRRSLIRRKASIRQLKCGVPRVRRPAFFAPPSRICPAAKPVVGNGYNGGDMTIAETSILIVDDEPALREALTYSLAREGYAVKSASTYAEAFATIENQMPSFIVLDLGLPDIDGLELCRAVRSRSSVPILMLTARQSEVDKIVGLEMGSDDYMTKPFSMRELLARVKAILRRSTPDAASPSSDVISFGETTIDRLAHRVTHRGQEITLTPLEFEMLSFLAENRGIVFSRETLLDRVWKYSYPEGSRTVDVHMRWLRQKLEDDPANPRMLVTVRGVGYKLEA